MATYKRRKFLNQGKRAHPAPENKHTDPAPIRARAPQIRDVTHPLPHCTNLSAVPDFIKQWSSDAGINLSVEDRDMPRQPVRFGSPAGLKWPNRRHGSQLCLIPQLMKAGYSRQALATNTGGSKETKRRAAFGTLVAQAEAFHHISLYGLERFRRSLLRDVRIRCLACGAPKWSSSLRIGRK
jgi:hypothetical protein